MFDMDKDQIVFIAKHKEWVAIKKLLIDEYVKTEDISLILSQVQKTINEKSFLYAEIQTETISEIVKKYCAQKRKGIKSLSEIFGNIKTPSLKKELLTACKTDKHYPLAEQYFLNKVMEELGYPAYPNLEALQKIYPHMKIAKPRGNFGKKKKKK